jgi:hypothetical protein
MQINKNLDKPTNIFISPIKRIMIASLCCLLLSIVNAQGVTPTKQINIDLPNSTLKQLFTVIEQKSEFRFFYDAADININQAISAKYINASIELILNKELGLANLDYEIKGNQIIVKNRPQQTTKIADKTVYQGIPVTGIVTDDNGEPLPGVNVVVNTSLSIYR